MLSTARRLFGTSPELRRRIVRLYAFLVAFNVVAWGLVLVASISYPILLPTALLAYSFGLRHAVDADHIAAIDNSTRKLMQDGKRPVAVGLFFSLGHSTIVVALSVLIAASAAFISDVQNGTLRSIGGIVGTIGFGVVPAPDRLDQSGRAVRHLPDVPKGLRGRHVRRGVARGLPVEPRPAGPTFRPALKSIRESWHMYPLGVLFGLGFDTASEVALLGLAATSGASHLPIWLIVLLPAVFAAGMSLVDATDGVLMLGAYGWAYIKPIRKLYYNLNITLVSVLIAFLVGGLEALSVIGSELGLSGGIWALAGGLDMGMIGVAIVALLVGSWLISTLIYRWKRYDERGPSTPNKVPTA